MPPTDDSPSPADQHLSQIDARDAEFEHDVLQQAKARQDRSHAALDVWIATAIAELAAER
jgi:hypothetical protein